MHSTTSVPPRSKAAIEGAFNSFRSLPINGDLSARHAAPVYTVHPVRHDPENPGYVLAAHASNAERWEVRRRCGDTADEWVSTHPTAADARDYADALRADGQPLTRAELLPLWGSITIIAAVWCAVGYGIALL